jgi:hypothetical protein
MAIGDLKNDGRPGVVTPIGTSTAPVKILLNNGAGGFGTAIDYGPNNASSAVIGDFIATATPIQPLGRSTRASALIFVMLL